jgi:hypothetical protein
MNRHPTYLMIDRPRRTLCFAPRCTVRRRALLLTIVVGAFGVTRAAAREPQTLRRKAIRDPQAQSIEIYDLSTDIRETHDLAADHPELVVRFRDYFESAREPSPYWPVRAGDRLK